MTPEQFAQFEVFVNNVVIAAKWIVAIATPFFVWRVVYASPGLWDKFMIELSIATAKAKLTWWMPMVWFVLSVNIIYWIFTV